MSVMDTLHDGIVDELETARNQEGGRDSSGALMVALEGFGHAALAEVRDKDSRVLQNDIGILGVELTDRIRIANEEGWIQPPLDKTQMDTLDFTWAQYQGVVDNT